MDDARIVETADPAEAFGLLADETRVDILRALWEADEDALSFSALREAAGVDDSGQFNYHLGKLTDGFIAKGEDGYELTLAGMHVVGALLSGAYTMEGSLDAVPLEDPCPYCGGERTFAYEEEWVLVECVDCEVGNRFGVPPGAFAGYGPGAFPEVAERYLRTILSGLNSGFCTVCEGSVTPRLEPAMATDGEESELPEQYRELPTVRYDCDRCGIEIASDLGVAMADHPAVVSFYHDHGVDVRTALLSAFVAAGPDQARVLDRDPLRASVTYEADGESISLVVDERAEVVEIERSDGR